MQKSNVLRQLRHVFGPSVLSARIGSFCGNVGSLDGLHEITVPTFICGRCLGCWPPETGLFVMHMFFYGSDAFYTQRPDAHTYTRK